MAKLPGALFNFIICISRFTAVFTPLKHKAVCLLNMYIAPLKSDLGPWKHTQSDRYNLDSFNIGNDILDVSNKK